MKVSLKRSELQPLVQNLRANLHIYKGAKLSYAVVKNLRKLEGELKCLTEAKESTDLGEFERCRVAVCEKFADSEKPTNPDGTYAIVDFEGFGKAIDALREEYADAIQEYENFMNESCDLELHSINLEDLNDEMTGVSVSLIVPFLE